MLKQRIITALLLVPVALYGVFMLPLWGFALFIQGVLMLGAWEWSPLMGVRRTSARIAYTLFVGAIIGVLSWLAPYEHLWEGGELSKLIYYTILAGGVWWVVALAMIVNYPSSRRMWSRTRAIVGVFGLLIFIPTWAVRILPAYAMVVIK